MSVTNNVISLNDLPYEILRREIRKYTGYVPDFHLISKIFHEVYKDSLKDLLKEFQEFYTNRTIKHLCKAANTTMLCLKYDKYNAVKYPKIKKLLENAEKAKKPKELAEKYLEDLEDKEFAKKEEEKFKKGEELSGNLTEETLWRSLERDEMFKEELQNLAKIYQLLSKSLKESHPSEYNKINKKFGKNSISGVKALEILEAVLKCDNFRKCWQVFRKTHYASYQLKQSSDLPKEFANVDEIKKWLNSNEKYVNSNVKELLLTNKALIIFPYQFLNHTKSLKELHITFNKISLG
jgi:predicted DNA-binding protein